MEKAEESSKHSDNGGKGKKGKAVVEDLTRVESLENLILDTSFNKYDIVLLARRWAYELKAKEGETRSLQDLITVAIQDILSTNVNHKMVRGLPHFRSGKKPKTSLLDMLPKTGAKKE